MCNWFPFLTSSTMATSLTLSSAGIKKAAPLLPLQYGPSGGLHGHTGQLLSFQGSHTLLGLESDATRMMTLDLFCVDCLGHSNSTDYLHAASSRCPEQSRRGETWCAEEYLERFKDWFSCRRGEEVVFQYNPSLERNDRTLLSYFFVQGHDPPPLCLLDLPEHGRDGNAPRPLPNDAALYGPGGHFRTQVSHPWLHRELFLKQQASTPCLHAAGTV